MKQRKNGSIMRAVAAFMMLTNILAGCSSTVGKNETLQDPVLSGTENSSAPLDKENINPSDYVDLGTYEGIEIREDGLDVYVGEVPVSIPYRDEGSGTEWTLRYYYSQINPTEDRTNWVIPTDEDVARMGIPGVMSFSELKDYVLQKLNENDDITAFMMIADAFMEQVAANSAFQKIPEDVIRACEGIYKAYLEKMLLRYNEIGEIPVLQMDGSSAYKVLAAMAIAKETGMDMDTFDYEKVLRYLINLRVNCNYN